MLHRAIFRMTNYKKSEKFEYISYFDIHPRKFKEILHGTYNYDRIAERISIYLDRCSKITNIYTSNNKI